MRLAELCARLPQPPCNPQSPSRPSHLLVHPCLFENQLLRTASCAELGSRCPEKLIRVRAQACGCEGEPIVTCPRAACCMRWQAPAHSRWVWWPGCCRSVGISLGRSSGKRVTLQSSEPSLRERTSLTGSGLACLMEKESERRLDTSQSRPGNRGRQYRTLPSSHRHQSSSSTCRQGTAALFLRHISCRWLCLGELGAPGSAAHLPESRLHRAGRNKWNRLKQALSTEANLRRELGFFSGWTTPRMT